MSLGVANLDVTKYPAAATAARRLVRKLIPYLGQEQPWAEAGYVCGC